MRWIAAVLLVLLPTIAAANDAEYGNIAGTPAPVKNDSVRMASEDIRIRELSTGFWKVDATYTFENTADKQVSLTMGFPEQFGDEGKEFLKFVTTVRGAPVKVSTKKSGPMIGATGLDKRLGRVHLFEVAFAPKETVVVEHSYEMEGGGSVAFIYEKTVEYVTRTGAMWKGPIGLATFTIETRDVHELLSWSPEFEFKSLERVVHEPGVRTGMRLVLENKDWTPKGDLRVDVMTDYDRLLMNRAVGGDCPELRTKRGYEDAPVKDREAMVEVGPLDGFDSERLRHCRNWRYARYGYKFRDPKLNARFYGEVGVIDYPPVNIEPEYKSKRLVAPLMADPGFTPKMLTAADLVYLKTLRAEERRRREATNDAKAK